MIEGLTCSPSCAGSQGRQEACGARACRCQEGEVMCGCIGCIGPADALQQHGGAKQNGITLSVEAPTLQAAAPAKAVNPLFEKRTRTFGELLPC